MSTNGLFGVLLVALLVAVASRATGAEPEVYATINLGKNMASHAEFSPDGKRLAYVQSGGKLVLWDVTKKEATVVSETKGLYGLVWSSDGKCLYVISFSAVCRIDAATGERTKLYVHDDKSVGEATAIKYIPEKKQLVSGSSDGSIVVWDAEKDKLVKKLTCPEEGLVFDLQPVPGTSKLAVAASLRTTPADDPNVIEVRKVLYTADLTDGTFTMAIDPAKSLHGGGRRQLAATHAGGEYAFADPDNEAVVISDVATGKSRTIKDCPLRPVACKFSQSDRYLFMGGAKKSILDGIDPFSSKGINPFSSKGAFAIYDMTTDKWATQMKKERATVSSLSYSPSANLLACTFDCREKNEIIVWDLKGIVDPAAKKEKKEKK